MEVCPNCHHDDEVKRVGELYRQLNSEEGSEIGGDLGTKLAPPAKPVGDFYFLTWYIVPLIPLVDLILVWFAPLDKTAKRIFSVAWILVAGFWIWRGITHPVGAMAMLPFASLALWVAVYYAGLMIEQRRRKAKYELLILPPWEQAMERWEKLGYCGRCQVVFTNQPLSGSPASVPVGEQDVLIGV
ncbi:MAG: hypothetical protein ACM3MK_09445 [Chitinophagales bacterium]